MESACLILECERLVVVVDSLVFDRCAHSECGVATLAVVEDLEVFEDGVGQLDPGAPPLPVEQFDLHASPERLDHGVDAPIGQERMLRARGNCPVVGLGCQGWAGFKLLCRALWSVMTRW